MIIHVGVYKLNWNFAVMSALVVAEMFFTCVLKTFMIMIEFSAVFPMVMISIVYA